MHLGDGYKIINPHPNSYRSLNDEVSLTADLVLGRLVSEFLHELICLDVDVLATC